MFCTKVRTAIHRFSFFPGHTHPKLQEMIGELECCRWIHNESERVKEKTKISSDAMKSYCRKHAINRRALLSDNRPGAAVAMACAVLARPEKGDTALFLDCNPISSQWAFSTPCARGARRLV